MVKCSSIEHLKTNRKKDWRYDEYYIGEKDRKDRRSGQGENHWTGAKSIEWYTGQFLHDTMHGEGDYRWRHYYEEGTHETYEGNFHANSMHGYGTISYPDGRVFSGLFYKNFRWGPGIETYTCLNENVGFWYGKQLIRLAWNPSSPPLIPYFISNPAGGKVVESHRVTLTEIKSKVNEINSALDLLKQCGADPQIADERWRSLYPQHCTDLKSALCNKGLFNKYYHKQNTLVENLSIDQAAQAAFMDNDKSDFEMPDLYYAWNNSPMMIAMMKHCYLHEEQRLKYNIDMPQLWGGPRNKFKPAAKHEINCRTLIMASYLGYTSVVAQMINEEDIFPDVADNQGNTTLMYAVCGDRIEAMKFLIDAGANVNGYNDSCCTPLGIALIRYLTVKQDIPINATIQVVLPPPPPSPAKTLLPSSPQSPVTLKPSATEWKIIRDIPDLSRPLTRSSSRLVTNKMSMSSSRKFQSLLSMKKRSFIRRKTDVSQRLSDNNYLNNTIFSDDNYLYDSMTHEYLIKITDLFGVLTQAGTIQSIFQNYDMMKEMEEVVLPKQAMEKNPTKVVKEVAKPSKETVKLQAQNSEDIDDVVDIAELLKIEQLTQIKSTIEQLLLDGANPKMVYCPMPALTIAIAAESEELLDLLLKYGADPNERYDEMLNYTALEVAISRPMTLDNLKIVKTLLEDGSRADIRLHYEPLDPSKETVALGPTLLHAVLAKTPESDLEKDIQRRLLELLLDYGSDANAQFYGRSAIDLTISRDIDLLYEFIKSPKVDLNNSINENNHSALVKIFNYNFFLSMDRSESRHLPIITNLLLFGADPLLKCHDGDEVFQNLFVYAKEQLAENYYSQRKPSLKSDIKANKASALKVNKVSTSKLNKSNGKLTSKTQNKTLSDDSEDYQQAIDLVADCSRLTHIRWIQAKLLKELIEIVHRFKHRSWHLIMKEYKHRKETTMWLTAQRSLEIWDILRTSKKRIYEDRKVLKLLLCIVHYYESQHKVNKKITIQDKEMIEAYVKELLREYHIGSTITDVLPLKRQYIRPELDKDNSKFEVCFECLLPFTGDRITCHKCKLVAFCSLECIQNSVDRLNSHPCNSCMRKLYCPSPDPSLDLNQI